MIFLIEYNPPEGRIVKFKRYADADRKKAFDERLELELELFRKKVEHEVSLFEASSEEQLRRTHQRYFQTPVEMILSFQAELEKR